MTDDHPDPSGEFDRDDPSTVLVPADTQIILVDEGDGLVPYQVNLHGTARAFPDLTPAEALRRLAETMEADEADPEAETDQTRPSVSGCPGSPQIVLSDTVKGLTAYRVTSGKLERSFPEKSTAETPREIAAAVERWDDNRPPETDEEADP